MTPSADSQPELRRVLVVGAGLIGCSVGMALRTAGVDVDLADLHPERLGLASELGAGRPVTLDHPMTTDAAGRERYDVAIVCVPPSRTFVVLRDLLRRDLARAFSDVSSVKTHLQGEVESLAALSSTNPAASPAWQRFVGGHPVAGRERGGPAAARGDLFLGRPWALTPSDATDRAAVGLVEELVRTCGAIPVVLDPPTHDGAMALVSHAPQAVASLLAGLLRSADPAVLGLAGSGLRDLTRIADSDPAMWADIATANAGRLAPILRQLADGLSGLADGLEADPAAAFGTVVADGNVGRARLPGKHGGARRDYVAVPVVIADTPGILARLLTDAGQAGINVEDVVIEHSPGAPVGLCELVVAPEQADALGKVLTDRGWSVHPPAATTGG
jgi:prephenate dehydrogenase